MDSTVWPRFFDGGVGFKKHVCVSQGPRIADAGPRQRHVDLAH